MDLRKRYELRKLVRSYTDNACSTSDLLVLRDDLRQLADMVNDTYMNTRQLYETTCTECRVQFSILDTRKEDRRPSTCVECYEKTSPTHTSILREPEYAYTRYESERIAECPEKSV